MTDTATPGALDLVKLLREVDRLRTALVAAKRPHLVVDGDCWFSCPLAPSDWREGSACCDDTAVARGTCNCGADHANALIDAALATPTAEPAVPVDLSPERVAGWSAALAAHVPGSHTLIEGTEGFCPDCNGSCLVGFGNPAVPVETEARDE